MVCQAETQLLQSGEQLREASARKDRQRVELSAKVRSWRCCWLPQRRASCHRNVSIGVCTQVREYDSELREAATAQAAALETARQLGSLSTLVCKLRCCDGGR